jgi:hypothetical protein
VILVTGSATPAIINGMSSSGMAAGTMITFIVNVNFIQIFHNSSSASNTDYRLMLSDEGDGSIGALMLGPFLSATFVHQGAGGKWIEATVNVAGPRCEVQILGAQSIANNTTTVVNFDDEMFDIWGEFSTVTHLWTAREDMWVDVHGQVSMSTTAAVDLFVEVLINGSVQIALGIAAVPANRSATSHAQCRRYVLKGDTIGLKVLQQSGASQDLVNGLWTSMRISRIR